MAIGTAAAIGLGVAGVGSALSSKSNKKAASKAANVSQQNNAQNVALQREVYGQNKAALSPFMQRGNAAGDQLNAMLLGAPQQPQPNALAQFVRRPAAAGYGIADGQTGLGAPYSSRREALDFAGGQFPAFAQNALVQQQPAQENVISASSDPFQAFRDSTGFQFRLQNALDGVNSGYAGRSVLQSGAAIQAAQDRAADVATESFGQYAGMLQGQQAVGAGAASALAGVGQNFANSVTASNNMNSANQANALLYQGQNNFGNTLGMLGGVLTGLGR